MDSNDTTSFDGQSDHISLSSLNSHFVCVACFSSCERISDFLNKPNHIGVRVQPAAFHPGLKFLRGASLHDFARSHGVSGKSPQELRETLSRHECSSNCAAATLIFRRLAVPRRRLDGMACDSDVMLPLALPTEVNGDRAGRAPSAQELSVGCIVGDGSDILRKDWSFRKFTIDYIQGVNDTIPVRRLNEFYSLHSMPRTLVGAEPLLRNPDLLVVEDQPSLLVQAYGHFTLTALRNLAKMHGIRYHNQPVRYLQLALASHTCTNFCIRHFVVFKSLSKPRRFIESKRYQGILRRPPAALAAGSRVQIPSPESAHPCLLPGQELKAAEDYDAHLLPCTDKQKLDIVSMFQAKMALSNFLRKPCAVCSRLVFPSNQFNIHASTINLRVLRNDSLPPHLQPKSYNFEAYDRAILCANGLEDPNTKGQMNICGECAKDVEREILPKFALANWLYTGRDCLPPNIAQAFAEATPFERAMAARARSSGLCFRFTDTRSAATASASSKSENPWSFHKIRGNVVATPLDAFRMNKTLPPSPESIYDTICALFVGRTKPSTSTIHSLHPILARKSRIKIMLEFLLKHNPHYRPDGQFQGFSASNLESLLEAGEDVGVPKAVEIAFLQMNEAVDGATSSYSEVASNTSIAADDETYGQLLMENVGYTLGDTSRLGYRQMKLTALQHCLDGKPFILQKAGDAPLPDFDNPELLSWLFPHLDPWGIAGFCHPTRARYISMEEQIRYFLQVEDPCFEEDPEFAFVFYNIIRKKQVSETLRFRVPVAKYTKIVDRFVNLDCGQVMELEEKLRRDPACTSLDDSEKEIVHILESISPVARNIPGSAATRIQMRNEIRALINYRGPPALFITINPSDIHNPIVAVLANRCSIMKSIEKVLEQSTQQRLFTATKRPTASAIFFEAMMDSFIKIILGYNSHQPSKGVYGVCDAYYGTVEVQGRGSLHCHMLVWLRGHLPPQRLKERVIQDAGYRDKLIAWLDSVMQSDFLAAVPENGDEDDLARPGVNPGNPGVECINQIVEGLPSDPHPGSLVEPQASRLSPHEFWKEYRAYVNELLLRYNWHRHCATCWKYLKRGEPRTAQNCRFGLDGTTVPQTSVDQETGRVIVSRIQPMMTSFTSLVMFLLKCNMDVKFIGSGIEAKAFMYYVTDYITKSPLPTYQGLAALLYAIQQTRLRLPDLQLTDAAPAPNQLQSAITIAVNSMLGHTEFSKTQVLHQLLGGKEWITNEEFISINWGDISKYVQAVWRSIEEKVFSTDSPPDHQARIDPTAGANICITPNNGTVTISSHRLDYMHRPDHYSSVGLFNYFATTRKYAMQVGEYGPTPAKRQHLFSSEDHPQYRTHAVSGRRHAVIPVLLGPNLARSTSTDAEKEAWARDTLVLFKPWRTPLDLKHPSETWVAAMEKFELELSVDDKQRIAHMSALAEGREARSQFPRRSRFTHQSQPNDEFTFGEAAEEDCSNIESRQHEQNVYHAGFSKQPNCLQAGDQVAPILDPDVISAFNKCYNVPHEAYSGVAVDDSQRARPDLLVLAQHQYERLKGNDSGDDDSSTDEEDEANRNSNSASLGGQENLIQKPQPHVQEPNVSVSTLREGIQTDYQVRNDGAERDQQFKQYASLVDSIAIAKGIKNNPEQLRAFYIVAKHIINGGPQLLMHIGGMGGTGKSYVVGAIVELFDQLQRRHELVIGAPTGIAAALIGGSTLHSLILSNPSQKTQRSDGLAEIWMSIRYMIADEVSMIGARFLAEMSSRMQIGKADIPWASAQPFGGISIIFTGDFCQLTPPRQKSLFSYELVHSPSFSESRGVEGINNLAGAYLWRQVCTVVLLKKNHRQSEDPTYAEILELIRKGAGSDAGGNARWVGNASILTHLRERVLQQVRHHSPHAMEAFRDAPVIVGSKRLRDLLNVRLIQSHAARTGREVHLYYSRDTVRRRDITIEWVRNHLWNLPSRRTRDSFGFLPLFVGMKIMITENIAVPHRAVNGAEGVVEKIYYTEGKDGVRYAEVVYVKIPKSGVHLPGLEKDVIPIFPTSTSIKHTLTIGTSQIKSFTRRQCPLVPAYCYTDYKSQGRSLDKAVVDLTSARSQEGVYVMLSRVKSLDGLLILRWFPETKVTQRLSGELREELSRLETLDRLTVSVFNFSDNESGEGSVPSS